MTNLGFVKVAACTPELLIANPKFNIEKIIAASKNSDASVIAFPELCVTGYTCADLFRQRTLLDASVTALEDLRKASLDMQGKLIAVGAPIEAEDRLYNCAVFIANGKYLGIVPKTHIPNYAEFYEARWFTSASMLRIDSVKLGEENVPIGLDLIFCDDNSNLRVGCEICEDLWSPNPPSSKAALAGANLIVNLSASNEVLTKNEYRRDLVRMQSARLLSAYLYVSAGTDESTSDTVFSGHNIIAQNGSIFAESIFENKMIDAVIDTQRLTHDRLRMSTFWSEESFNIRKIHYSGKTERVLPETVDAYPFVPSKSEERSRRCREIINLQSNALATRYKKTGMKKAVIGISGGLDSTLALIVTAEAFKKCGIPEENIIAVTMPGFGTTDHTLENAKKLISLLGAECRTVDIKAACLQHFSDIGHDPDVHNIAYENTQARERTQILMDIANESGALVIGTGDLSELALGWCTYNGDHMSMYGVNAGVPKTLVKYVIAAYAEMHCELSEVLNSILETPISPELLPPDKNGKIAQKTEDTIGKYDVNDFILFHVLRCGDSPEKIYELAKIAFPSISENELENTMENFYKRFFTQQFKRNCLPDSVKIGSVCFSPRADWRMPSDASYAEWIDF